MDRSDRPALAPFGARLEGGRSPDLSFRAQRGICFPSPVATDDRFYMPPQLQLVQQELRFHFIGRHDRRILFSVQAASLDEAQQKFQAAGHCPSEALLIIKTETQIFLA